VVIVPKGMAGGEFGTESALFEVELSSLCFSLVSP